MDYDSFAFGFLVCLVMLSPIVTLFFLREFVSRKNFKELKKLADKKLEDTLSSIPEIPEESISLLEEAKQLLEKK